MSGGMIIAGYDGREGGHDAVALGALLARRPGTRLIIAAVYRSESHRGEAALGFRGASRANVEAKLAEVAAEVPYGVRFETRAISGSSPEHALADLAALEAAEQIVLGSSHYGPFGRVLLGTAGDRLARTAPCAVSVAPHGFAERAVPIGTIGVAFDGRPEAWVALRHAADLAQALRSRLRLLSVDASSRSFADARAWLPEKIEVEEDLVKGEPVLALARAARRVDLLVTGSRGHGPLRRSLLGGMSEQLVRAAPCPICVVGRASVRGAQAAA